MNTHAKEELDRWPKYKELYLRAFARMIKVREETGKDNMHPCDWSTPEKVMEWWLQGQQKEK